MYPLRSVTEQDIPRLAVLGAQTFIETFGDLYSQSDIDYYLDHVYSERVILAEWKTQGMDYRIIESGSGPFIGYCKIGPVKVPIEPSSERVAELRQLYVLAAYQGHGLGTRLIEWALQEFQSRALDAVYVSVFSENLGAQRLYARHGFRHFGEYAFMVGQQADREFIMRRDMR